MRRCLFKTPSWVVLRGFPRERGVSRLIFAQSLTSSPSRGHSKELQVKRDSQNITTLTRASTCSQEDSTIYALSTAPGRAAIAIVRLSGPACSKIFRSLCPGTTLPRPRLAVLRTLYDPTKSPSNETILDSGALILYFKSPNSVTGEDVLEFHLHGGPAIVKAVLAAIASCDTPERPIIYAQPGEFTRRAFMNNRLDLPQIEALGDTLTAETEQQRRLAVRGTSNMLAKRYESWRIQLLYARGELEALIDFSEDQHFDESPRHLTESVAAQVRGLAKQLTLHIQNASKGELLRSGIQVALLGAPNAGKSSLLNRIVGKEAAIVSTEEGTTRDIVDVGVDLGGWFCRLGDMAGLRSSAGSQRRNNALPLGKQVTEIGFVEREGIRRAKNRALESDVVIVVLSVEPVMNKTQDYAAELFIEPEVVDAVRECQRLGKCIVVAINKSDQMPPDELDGGQRRVPSRFVQQITGLFTGLSKEQIYTISCTDAKEVDNKSSTEIDPGNIQLFLHGLITNFERIAKPESLHGTEHDLSYWQDSLGVTHRQRSNLEKCLQHLNDFLDQETGHNNNTCFEIPQNQTPLLSNSNPASHEAHNDYRYKNTFETDHDIVTAAEHLRFAADSLAKITGKGEGGDVEDILGVVFEKFCVGK